MPNEIRVEICKFDGCQQFDLRACGSKLQAIEQDTITGIYGAKTVTIFEPRDTAEELDFTIKRVRGDVNIRLPADWTVDTTASHKDDVDAGDLALKQLPRVTAEKDGRMFDVGVVNSPVLTLHFRKQARSF